MNKYRNKASPKQPISPLWVIALFVSLTEVVAGLTVSQAKEGIQIALVVFVIGFPLLVAAAFFAILWWKNWVLYPPSEFSGVDVEQFVLAMNTQFVLAMKGTGPMLTARDQLRSLIDGLDAAKAIALVTKVAADFSKAKAGIESLDPDRSSASDETGSKARVLLKRLVNLTAFSPQDADKWQAAIDSL